MGNGVVVKRMISRVNAGKISDTEDILSTEEPLEIRLLYGTVPQRKSLAVTMRTPSHDEELAAGFLYTEGIIRNINDIAGYKQAGENILEVSLHITPELKHTERNFYTTSSCGVCGKASIDAIRTECTLYDKARPFTVAAGVINNLPSVLRAQQPAFNQTGGIHATALFDSSGNLLLVREDVGRHNAMDKLVGAALNKGMVPLQEHVLLLSGRASFELVQKAVMAGVKMVAAVGAPSSLAVETADEFGVTLIGFVREDRFNIYTEKERITI